MQAATPIENFIPVYNTPVVKKLSSREKRIAKIKEKIAAGTYHIASAKLAKALLCSF